jgi:hypothetical protein
MFKSIVVSAALGLATAVAAPAFAQSHKVEVSAFGGWVFSDGVSGQTVQAGDGKFYNRVDPKDSGSFGLSVGFHVSDKNEVGFMYGRQFSSLTLGGQDTRDLGSMGVDNYHGYFGYNFGEHQSKVRPFAFIGLGATHYGTVTSNLNGTTRLLGGETQFSTKWGGGVKFFASPHVGLRVAFSWTPTYIKSDAAGWWCDPFWGYCYVVGSSQYSNQFEFSGGVTIRFEE